MSRLILIALLFIGSPAALRAQPAADTAFTLVKTLREQMTDFAVDNLGNLYVMSPWGQLKKMGPNGDSLAVFNDVKRYGRLHSIDVSNPLHLLLYYKDFGTVVVLDRYLNVRATLDLRKLNLFDVSAIGLAYDNNIWVFDGQESKLKRVGLDGQVIDQSVDFRSLFDALPSPQVIEDQNQYVYLYDPAKGVYTFDYYGTLKNHIPLTGWSDFTVINNVLYGHDDHFLFRYQPGTLNLQTFPIPGYLQNARKILVSRDNLYVFRDSLLEVYTYH